MLDFSDVGDIGVFIDEAVMGDLEQHIAEQGYLDGTKVAATFRALRSNDLIWSFFVNNFLLGRQPLPLDLLYWNSDPTHMPAAMHTFFMRNMYLENRLREPGGVTLADVPIDLSKVETPSYILSTYDDHIAPWRTTYASTQLFAGQCQFVLGSSGHIAGVINPPRRNKYGFWTNGAHPPGPGSVVAERAPARGVLVAALARVAKDAHGRRRGGARPRERRAAVALRGTGGIRSGANIVVAGTPSVPSIGRGASR